MEYEQVREEAIRRTKNILELPADEYNLEQVAHMIVDWILPIGGIEIKADDQNLPELSNNSPSYWEQHYAQQDMLKAGFIRVIPKPKRK